MNRKLAKRTHDDAQQLERHATHGTFATGMWGARNAKQARHRKLYAVSMKARLKGVPGSSELGTRTVAGRCVPVMSLRPLPTLTSVRSSTMNAPFQDGPTLEPPPDAG